MALIKQLKDFFSKTVIYPVTVTNAVFDKDGNRLSDFINGNVISSELKDEDEPVEDVQLIADRIGNYTAEQIGDIVDNFVEKVEDVLIVNNVGSGGTGSNGKSAYEIAYDNGFEGTEEEWLESLKGETGAAGKDGTDGKDGEDGKSAYEIACDNGFVGTEEEWLESLKGETGAAGKDGADGSDGKDGEDGKSAYEIACDNGFVGTEEEWLESLKGENSSSSGSSDIHADFLSEEGFGNLRYYQGSFQYYDSTTSTWIDTTAVPDNALVLALTPKPMDRFTVKYDKSNKAAKLFIQASDTIIDGQIVVFVEKIIIRRKVNSIPEDENDGDLVTTIPRSKIHAYANNPYKDDLSGLETDVTYCYKAFPVGSSGLVCNSSINVAQCTIRSRELYGFRINQNESNPYNMIEYLEDCDNALYNAAYMDYTTKSFYYGEWESAWFISGCKPCLLNQDGTVECYLNPNNYNYDIDGGAVDITLSSSTANVMVEIPKVYWKIIDNGDGTNDVYVCDVKLDDDFKCWSHIDSNGNEIDCCYMAAFEAYNKSSILRSMSGVKPTVSMTYANMSAYASANNQSGSTIWQLATYADRVLINLLLLLISKSPDSQTSFGNGTCSSSTISDNGTLIEKGMFYGTSGDAPVKVFHMEHWWGNVGNAISGWLLCGDIQKVKLTYGTTDGSETDGYNATGDGYISVPNSAISGSSGSYLDKFLLNEYGMLPSAASGIASSTTYFTDAISFVSGSTLYIATCGGDRGIGMKSGAYAVRAISANGNASNIGTAIACKPLSKV